MLKVEREKTGDSHMLFWVGGICHDLAIGAGGRPFLEIYCKCLAMIFRSVKIPKRRFPWYTQAKDQFLTCVPWRR